jgi:hypothetical protein
VFLCDTCFFRISAAMIHALYVAMSNNAYECLDSATLATGALKGFAISG